MEHGVTNVHEAVIFDGTQLKVVYNIQRIVYTSMRKPEKGQEALGEREMEEI